METHIAQKYIFNNQFFGIGKAQYSKACSFEAHKHDFLELVYIISGKSSHCVDDYIYEVNQGDLLFVGSNQIHSFSSADSFSHINIYIKPEYICNTLSDAKTIYDVFSYFITERHFTDEEVKLPLITFDWSERLEFENLLNKCITEEENKKTGYEFALNGYIQLIFASIIRTLRKNESSEIIKTITPQILEYVNENYDKSLTLSDIANKCFYSPSHISKAFKKVFNMSLKDYISEKRIQKAEELLLETDDSVESISAKVGYANKNQFYRIFKSKTGCTPKQYRNKNK